MLTSTLLSSILIVTPAVLGAAIEKRQTTAYFLGCYTYSFFDGEAFGNILNDNSAENCMAYFPTAPVVTTAGTICSEGLPINAYNLTHGQVADSLCTLPCPGNAAETCGDGSLPDNNYLSVYGTTPRAWSSVGCYQDVSGGALREHSSINFFGMTQESCESTCKTNGYIFAALESGYKCTCGNTLYATTAAASSHCNTRCTGNRNEKCGGQNYISLFEYN